MEYRNSMTLEVSGFLYQRVGDICTSIGDHEYEMSKILKDLPDEKIEVLKSKKNGDLDEYMKHDATLLDLYNRQIEVDKLHAEYISLIERCNELGFVNIDLGDKK